MTTPTTIPAIAGADIGAAADPVVEVGLAPAVTEAMGSVVLATVGKGVEVV